MQLQLYRTLFVPVAVLLLAMALFAFANTASAQEFVFEADLSGSEEVPSISANTTGNSSVEFEEDGADMEYALSVFKGDEITAAHLHCADDGENGPVVVGLFKDESGRDVNGSLSEGDIDASDIENADCESTVGYDIDSLSDLAEAIEDGDIYVNVHSTAYPNGVVRGQLSMGNDSDDDDNNDVDEHQNDHDDDNKGHQGGYKNDYDDRGDEWEDNEKDEDKGGHNSWNNDGDEDEERDWEKNSHDDEEESGDDKDEEEEEDNDWERKSDSRRSYGR